MVEHGYGEHGRDGVRLKGGIGRRIIDTLLAWISMRLLVPLRIRNEMVVDGSPCPMAHPPSPARKVEAGKQARWPYGREGAQECQSLEGIDDDAQRRN